MSAELEAWRKAVIVEEDAYAVFRAAEQCMDRASITYNSRSMERVMAYVALSPADRAIADAEKERGG